MKNFYRTISCICLLAICQSAMLSYAQPAWFVPETQYAFNVNLIAGPPEQRMGAISQPVEFLGRDCALFQSDELPESGCQAVYPPMYLYESNDSVFFALPNDEAFRLAYTFAATVGDTWQYSLPNTTGIDDEDFVFDVEVVETGEVLAGDGATNLRTLKLEFTTVSPEIPDPYFGMEGNRVDVVEFVGSMVGLIIPMTDFYGFCGFDNPYTLRCMQSESVEFLNPDFEACLASTQSDKVIPQVEVFPNPAREYVQVAGLGAFGPTPSVAIFNSQGKMVKGGVVVSPANQIDVSTLPSGIYFIRVTSNSGGSVVAQPFVVRH